MDDKNKYNNALEKLQEALAPKDGREISGLTRGCIEEIFPELKESEDERIRRNIIAALKGEGYYNCDLTNECISWLEKQQSVEEIVERCKKSWYNEGKIAGMAEGLTDDEKYQQGWHDALKKQCKRLENYDEYERGRADAIEDTCKWLSQQGDMLEDCFSDINDFVDLYKEAVGGGEKPQGKSALEAIKEEKVDNVNKVKPKFHKGEWIVWQDKCYKVNYNGCGYELVDQNGLSTSLEYGTIDENAHHWDITKDAKPGDVLASNVLISKYNKPFIYNGNHNSTHVGAYCGISTENRFNVATKKCRWTANVNIRPATKEQRDLLFQKMKEAGYEWDAEKKEPKKD